MYICGCPGTAWRWPQSAATMKKIKISIIINIYIMYKYNKYYFFIVLMNDFSNTSKLFYTILFADDTSVFLEGTEYPKLIETVNYELNKVTILLNANKLTININRHITCCFIDQE